MARYTAQVSGEYADFVKFAALAEKTPGVRFKLISGDAIRLSRSDDDDEVEPTKARVAEILGSIGLMPSQS